MIPDPEVAFQILALNTEKAHNLRDKALEVIRMYRARLEERPKSAEKDFAFEFERAHFITLGLLYEKKPRFSGGVYAPLLSRVDGFLTKPLKDAIEDREERAAQVERADDLAVRAGGRGQEARPDASLSEEFYRRAIQSAHSRAQKSSDLQSRAREHDQSARGIRSRQDSLRSDSRRRSNRRRDFGRRSELKTENGCNEHG